MSHTDPTPREPGEHDSSDSETFIPCGDVSLYIPSQHDLAETLQIAKKELVIASQKFYPETTGLYSSCFEQYESRSTDRAFRGTIVANTEGMSTDTRELYSAIASRIDSAGAWTAQVSQTDNYIRGIACISAQAPRVLSATVELKHTDTGTLTITMEACAYGDALDAGDCTDVYAFLQLWGLLQNSVMLPQPEPIEIEIKRFGVTDTGIMIGGALFLHNATAKDGSPRFDVEHIDVQEIAEDFEDLTDEQLADAISYLHDTYHDKELFTMADLTDALAIICYDLTNQPEQPPRQ
ncbi:hypothetical protein KBD87_04225 [Candidatus Saccharibacteria bacterium]|nr:hypothetical protein [Candidatus Saccharibacteria bacterium]